MAFIRCGAAAVLSHITAVFAHDAYSTAPSFTAEVGKYYIVTGGGANVTATNLLTAATGADIIEQSNILSDGGGGAFTRQLGTLIKANATTVTLTATDNLNYYVFKVE